MKQITMRLDRFAAYRAACLILVAAFFMDQTPWDNPIRFLGLAVLFTAVALDAWHLHSRRRAVARLLNDPAPIATPPTP